MVKLLKLLILFFTFFIQQIITNYISIDITTDKKQINVQSSYTFTLSRNINPLTSDFVVPTTVTINSTIQIIFPTDYLTISNSNTTTCNDAVSGLALNCEISQVSRTLTIKDYYSNSVNIGNIFPSIKVNSILNPSKSGLTGNFQYYIRDSLGNIIDQSPAANNGIDFPQLSFDPGVFQACKISAQGATILTRSRLMINLTAKNNIPSSGRIGLQIPLTWNNDVQNSRTISTAPTCSAVSNVLGTLTCSYSVMAAPVNKIYVTITGITSTTITSSIPISISIQSVLTPPYIQSTDNIQIYSQWSDGSKIDTCSAKITDLTAIKFQTATFQSTNNTLVQSSFIGRLSLIIARPFYYEDTIVFTLPSFFLNAAVSTNAFGSISQTKDSSASSITLSNFPTTASKSTNTQLNFTLQNIFNPTSVKPITIIVSFYRVGSLYQQSTIEYKAVTGTATFFQLRPSDGFVNAKGNCQMEIQTNLMIPTGSKLKISYPATVSVADSSSLNTNSALLNGISVSGSTFVTFSNTIIFTNVFQTNFTNGTLLIDFPQFQNPPTIQSSIYLLTVQSSDEFNIFTSSFTITAILKGLINNVITTSSSQVLSTSVITVNLQLNYPATSIVVNVPSDIVIKTGFQTTCLPNTLLSCSLNGSALTFEGNFASGKQTLSWGNTQNPNSFQPTQAFTIFTYNRGWGVQKSLGYLYLIMNRTASFSSILILPSSLKNSDTISVTFSINFPVSSPVQGQFSILIPSDLNIASATCNITCIKLSNKVVFSLNNVTKFDIKLSGVINSPSFKPNPDFIFSYINSNNYDSLYMTKASWTNNIASSFSTAVSTGNAYRGESALFKFGITSLSSKQTYVSIVFNDLFGALASPPSGGALLGTRNVRFDISNQTSTDVYMNLVTPTSFGDYTFSMTTFIEIDGVSYLMSRSVSNVWRHSCYMTLCRECDASNITKCINCYSKSISDFYIFDTALTTCRRDCNSGFYLTNNGTSCSPCSTNCLQCANTSTNCTSCDPLNSLYLDSNYKKCVSKCDDGYYANIQINQCLICNFPCLYCNNSAIKCTYCVSERFLLNQDCLTNCPLTGQYIQNSTTRTCDKCVSNCLTCQNFTNFCTSCDTSKLLYLQNKICVTQCQNNSFIDISLGVCVPCKSPCSICYNSATKCSKCISNSSTPYWYNYDCINSTSCPLGNYINQVNSSCDSCKPQCSACSSLIICTACNINYALYQSACISDCPNTTYQKNRICQPCTGCYTCLSSNLTCTSCISSQFLYNGKCYDQCPDGTFRNISTRLCDKCSNDCPTCLNSTFCLTCIVDLYYYLGKCNIDCPSGSFQNIDLNSTKICTQCPEKCLQCTSLTDCQSCKLPFNLQNDNTCVATCSIGLASNQICYPCGLNCANCNKTSGKCNLCDSNYYIYQDKCIGQCPLTTLSLNGLSCVSCTVKFGDNCTTCLLNECLSCADGQLKDGQCKPCSQGTYPRSSKCSNCPASCKSCINQTYCLSCNNLYYMEQNFCTATCPINKVPNGTRCSICLEHCSRCNLQNSLCSICNSGYYIYESRCLDKCPQNFVVNIDSTKCITQEQYYIQYSKAAKVVYFPFTIAGILIVCIGIIIKCHSNLTNLVTLLCAVVSFAQIASWAAFLYVQYSALINYHNQALKGTALTGAGIIFLIIIAIIHLKFYLKYLRTDSQFKKWQNKNFCTDKTFLVLATIFNFKIYRIVHSRLLERDEFSMKLITVNKLLPFSLLSVISLASCSIPIIVASSLALYFSIDRDQEFFAALDCLLITSIMAILVLIDLKHDSTYFVIEIQSSNLKRQMYEQDSFKLSINGQQNNNPLDEKNMSKAELLQAYDRSSLPEQSANKLKVQTSSITNDFKKTQAQTGFKDKIQQQNDQIQQIDINNQQIQFEQISEQGDQALPPQAQKQKFKWVQKKYDRHGYLIQQNGQGQTQLYDQNGYRVQIDENGQHHKFDSEGNQVKQWNGKFWIIDEDGFYVDKQTGKRYNQKGYQVRKNQKGELQYYDDEGFLIVQDEDGNLKRYDEYGNLIEKDSQGRIHRYTKQGHEMIISQTGKITFKDKDGNHLRINSNGEFQMYDPEDGFRIVKDSNGNITKYDKFGYRIEKDKWGNIYRYDQKSYRVVLGPSNKITKFDKNGYEVVQLQNGEIKLYDKEGYQVRFDENNKARFYDKHGYEVLRDYDGQVTLVDKDGLFVIIDQKTGQHKRYTAEGLQVVKSNDGKTRLYDKRGNEVVELEDGQYEKYDKLGNRVQLDEFGFQTQFIDDQKIRYDKVGNKVDQDQFQQRLLQQQDQMQNGQNKQKIKRFKNIKVALDLQNQYSKMVNEQTSKIKQDEQKQQIIFQQDINLNQFHDSQIFMDRDFQDEYRILKDGQFRIQNHQNDEMNLQELKSIDHNPQKDLKERKDKNRKNVNNKSGRFRQGDVLDNDPDQDYVEMKSVADASINQRSFDNQGVQPIEGEDSQYSELESMDQLSPNLAKRSKRKRGQHSQMSFINGDNMDTKTEYNHKKVNVQIKNKNIYDQNQEIQSLNEQNWVQNAQGRAFYNFNKDLSNANTNTNIHEIIYMDDVQDQTDTLSNFMKQNSNRSHKQSPRKNMKNRYGYDDKNTIEEMENELFEKQMDEGIKQRSEFKLANGPNPLVEYAKNLENNKKSLQQKMYFQQVNKKKKRR